MHFGEGSGLTIRNIGQQIGNEKETPTTVHMPHHTHIAQGSSTVAGGIDNPTNALWGSEPAIAKKKPYVAFTNASAMNPVALQPNGGNQPHDNMQPYLAMNFIICLNDGEYPPRG